MRTSSRSLRKPLKMGTRSAAVSWSPRITASSWMENASVRRTFHWGRAEKNPEKGSTKVTLKEGKRYTTATLQRDVPLAISVSVRQSAAQVKCHNTCCLSGAPPPSPLYSLGNNCANGQSLQPARLFSSATATDRRKLTQRFKTHTHTKEREKNFIKKKKSCN